MKNLFAFVFVLALGAHASAANLIQCSNSNGEFKIKRQAAHGYSRWLITRLDESLSSSYLNGRMAEDGEVMVRWEMALNDILGAGDGNYGIKLTAPKGSLKSLPGTEFQATLEVNYDDIAQDYVKNELSCMVVK